ncbi:MAG: hypothetical protein ABSG97_01305 [Sedimentisphaerales bacterium]
MKMAEDKFGKLTEADNILFAAVADGKRADYRKEKDKGKPENANTWGEERTIDANRIEWLCRDKQAKELVTDKGIQVIGAKIVGAVDLSFAEVPFPLSFIGCVFTEKIDIFSSRIKFLVLDSSQTRSIQADGVKVEIGVFMNDGFRANGEVSFKGATIGCDFACVNGVFINKGGTAISADGINVNGSVFLKDGFKADGAVRFPGASIGGRFDCSRGEFNNKGGAAIYADEMNVKASVFLKNGFNSNGLARFCMVTIGGDFDCENGKFVNEGGTAISADGMEVKGSVFLRNGFKSNGMVHFYGVAIGGDFDCLNGIFINEIGQAISADGMDVKGSVFLRDGFKAEGEVRFPRAAIGGDFDCSDGNFINVNKTRYTILADGMDVKGNVFLRNGFKSNGMVHFHGVVIGGDFDCINGKFVNEIGRTISADGMNVKGSVFLRDGFKANGEVSFSAVSIGRQFSCINGEFININKDGRAISADEIYVNGDVLLKDSFKANGEVCFTGAKIDGTFDCANGEFVNKGGRAISADGMNVKVAVFLRNSFKAEGLISLMGATVGEHFFWKDVNLIKETKLDLRNAKTRVLNDDEKSWPDEGNLFLDGFVYEDIGDKSPKDAIKRIDWLNRQGYERFRAGPYEQLAKVLEKMGHNEDAKEIRIEKEEQLTKRGGFGWLGRFWRGVLYWTIGYGYRPWQALWSIGIIIVLGIIVFGIGHKADVIVKTEEKPYHKFNALFYSIEMFVPVLDLHLKKYWIPDANKSGTFRLNKLSIPVRGNYIRIYMWFHIIVGWILTTLWIVGLTGLIKK